MSATTTKTSSSTLTVTCPSWCDTSVEEHVEDIWQQAGQCLHAMPVSIIEDTVGFGRALEEPRIADPWRIRFSYMTNPEGAQTEAAVFLMGRASYEELTISQALAVADEIYRIVEVHRAGGGIG